MLYHKLYMHSPFHEFNHDEVASISRIKQHQTIGAGGLELKEEMHGRVGLQSGQRHVTGPRPETDGIGHDAAHAEACVKLAVGDVAVLAQVQVGHAAEREAL